MRNKCLITQNLNKFSWI